MRQKGEERIVYHRIVQLQVDEEVLEIGYYWEVDDQPFEGGYLVERSVVIRRMSVCRPVTATGGR